MKLFLINLSPSFFSFTYNISKFLLFPRVNSTVLCVLWFFSISSLMIIWVDVMESWETRTQHDTHDRLHHITSELALRVVSEVFSLFIMRCEGWDGDGKKSRMRTRKEKEGEVKNNEKKCMQLCSYRLCSVPFGHISERIILSILFSRRYFGHQFAVFFLLLLREWSENEGKKEVRSNKLFTFFNASFFSFFLHSCWFVLPQWDQKSKISLP